MTELASCRLTLQHHGASLCCRPPTLPHPTTPHLTPPPQTCDGTSFSHGCWV